MAPSHRILITGASGYLGGTLLARWKEADLPAYDKLFALVRTDAQADAVKTLYGAEPLRFNAKDEAATRAAIVDNKIDIVFFLIDAISSTAQVNLIKALADVKKLTGHEVHLLHTSGAKLFSSHAGAPTDRPLLDTDPDLFSIQKAQKSPFEFAQAGVDTNVVVTEQAEKYGVRSYVFAPCIVYGKGEGFGNIISIQTVAVVQAAKALGRLYKVDDDGRPTWPVCHILDNTTLYFAILRKILNGEDPGHGKNGFFLAASGSAAWDDIYAAMAAALAKRNVVSDPAVVIAPVEVRPRMAEALNCTVDQITVMVGGKCTFTAEHGKQIGWKPQYGPDDILRAADEEVELILNNL